MAITFSRTTKVYDPTTDSYTDSTVTIQGSAVQVKGTPDTYRALGLVEGSAPTLLFTPTSYNLRAGSAAFVLPGDTVQWPVNGPTYTAKSVNPIAPDGVVIAARIVVSR